jgi:hypothetical protein
MFQTSLAIAGVDEMPAANTAPATLLMSARFIKKYLPLSLSSPIRPLWDVFALLNGSAGSLPSCARSLARPENKRQGEGKATSYFH